jgi:hypothetical protein
MTKYPIIYGGAAPVVPAAAPVVPAATPVVPAAAPVVHAAAPVVHAAAPVVHAATPVVHAAAPVVPAAANPCSRDINEYFIPDEIFNDTKFVIKSNKFEFNAELNAIFEGIDIPVIDIEANIFSQDMFVFYIQKNNPNCNYLKLVINTEAEEYAALILSDQDQFGILQNIRNRLTNLNISRFSINSKITNWEKGGNLLGIPRTHTYITLHPDADAKRGSCYYIPDKCIRLKPYSRVEGHVDEVLTFMPYGLDSFKIWVYQPIFEENVLDPMKELITANFDYNRTKLEAKFGADRIVYFPTFFNENGFISNPPLFNKLSLKKNNSYLFVFPRQTYELEAMIEQEITIIRQNLPEFTINTNYIDTRSTHEMSGFGNSIGGNLHCIVKQVI